MVAARQLSPDFSEGGDSDHDVVVDPTAHKWNIHATPGYDLGNQRASFGRHPLRLSFRAGLHPDGKLRIEVVAIYVGLH
jgi:hypothetical protein